MKSSVTEPPSPVLSSSIYIFNCDTETSAGKGIVQQSVLRYNDCLQRFCKSRKLYFINPSPVPPQDAYFPVSYILLLKVAMAEMIAESELKPQRENHPANRPPA